MRCGPARGPKRRHWVNKTRKLPEYLVSKNVGVRAYPYGPPEPFSSWHLQQHGSGLRVATEGRQTQGRRASMPTLGCRIDGTSRSHNQHQHRHQQQQEHRCWHHHRLRHHQKRRQAAPAPPQARHIQYHIDTRNKKKKCSHRQQHHHQGIIIRISNIVKSSSSSPSSEPSSASTAGFHDQHHQDDNKGVRELASCLHRLTHTCIRER